MNKIVDKILELLPFFGDGLGMTESEVLECLGISHGSFFYSVKSLLDSGVVGYNVDKNRAKYYYKITDKGGSADEKPPNLPTSKSAAVKKSDKKKVNALINADYDDNCQGIFASKAAFLDAVSNGLTGYQYDYEDKALRQVFIVVVGDDGEQNILRYDYDILPSGAYEFWRFRIHQTYKRRGLELKK